jgi:hypothetical protein
VYFSSLLVSWVVLLVRANMAIGNSWLSLLEHLRAYIWWISWRSADPGQPHSQYGLVDMASKENSKEKGPNAQSILSYPQNGHGGPSATLYWTSKSSDQPRYKEWEKTLSLDRETWQSHITKWAKQRRMEIWDIFIRSLLKDIRAGPADHSCILCHHIRNWLALKVCVRKFLMGIHSGNYGGWEIPQYSVYSQLNQGSWWCISF